MYAPPDLDDGEHMPSRIDPAFVLAIQADDMPIALKNGARHIDAGSSVFGPALDTTAWPTGVGPSTLESVGLDVVDGKVCSGVYAAGDVVAGKKRTMIEAVRSGLRVGQLV